MDPRDGVWNGRSETAFTGMTPFRQFELIKGSLKQILKRTRVMFGIGLPELIVILLIVLVLFGANRLPEIGTGLGRAIRGFKKGLNEPAEINVTPDEEGTKKEKKS